MKVRRLTVCLAAAWFFFKGAQRGANMAWTVLNDPRIEYGDKYELELKLKVTFAKNGAIYV